MEPMIQIIFPTRKLVNMHTFSNYHRLKTREPRVSKKFSRIEDLICRFLSPTETRVYFSFKRGISKLLIERRGYFLSLYLLHFGRKTTRTRFSKRI